MIDKDININEYNYELPSEKIALFPLDKRDDSKLLVYNKGKMEHKKFHDLTSCLPSNALLFFNNTKVIPARLRFNKDTGAAIEIFLLNPIRPSTIISEVMNAVNTCSWKCTIGNLKRWNEGSMLTKVAGVTELNATLVDRTEGTVNFTWNSTLTFAEIIQTLGDVPLPPYLKRKADTADKERYQTIYSAHEGAVAAPTAGLHFTSNTLQSLERKGIKKDFLTLHVSAGTFQPVKFQNAAEHTMHAEQIIITKENLDNLLLEDKFIIPVGTTSMRTLESLYWFGVKLLTDTHASFDINQNDPYKNNSSEPSKAAALGAVKNYMDREDIETLIGNTSIYIMPGYKFRVCEGLITNFHQPSSTLILLVAAFIGEDWKKVYEQALNNNYRFLSYGDSSLLLP